MTSVTRTGIYFGYARVHDVVVDTSEKVEVPQEELETWPMVMSLGWNPFYKNEKLTAVSLVPSKLACSGPERIIT